MATEVLLPKLGLTMQEGLIEEWVAEPGSMVRPGDVLLRLGTDKVDVDVEAEAEGVFHPAVPAGVTLPAGTLIGWLLSDGEEPPGVGSHPATTTAEGDRAARDDEAAGAPAAPANGQGSGGRRFCSPNAARVASIHGVDLALVTGTGPLGRIVSEDVEEHLAAGVTAIAPAPQNSLVTPLVRRYARDRGVDPATVHGTGVGGRIRRVDIDEAVNGTAPPVASAAAAEHTPEPAGAAGGRRGEDQFDEPRPLRGMRAVIAGRMHTSLQEMAQLTLGYEVCLDALWAVREQLKRELAGSSQAAPSLNDFVVRAAALALREHPMLNATMRPDGIVRHSAIHVGLAVAVPDGLVVPVIRDTADLPLPALAARTSALAGAAREGRLRLADLEGATFAVTTLGAYGVDFFTPIIMPGNVAILGVGRMRDGVAWDGETPRRSRVLTLSLTFDHRAVDGAPAAEYLKTVSGLLRSPLRLLAG